jgi:DNA topoisomerase-3
MKVVITEKQSVARDIANLLGASQNMEGYLAGNGYCVVWSLGHLIGLGMPDTYEICGFNKASLPILPDPILLTLKKVKKNKDYVSESVVIRQLNIIGNLFNLCDSIIVATDAGNEGELIFRYIYEYLNCSKPFERLWISSLTESAIKDGFKNLKKGSELDGLYRAALVRNRADWLVGINATQALSLAAGDGVYSLGRVQTPTLALICKRFQEYENFKINSYWQIQLLHSKAFVDFSSLSKDKWSDLQFAEQTLKTIQRNGKVTVSSVETKVVIEQSPLLFDLTSLQIEANRKYNFSAEETLNIAQSLYEMKFITYPLTGSRFISEAMWVEIPPLIRALQHYDTCKQALLKVRWGRFTKGIINDLGVTNHHGLLITGKIPSSLTAKEHAIYNMIAFRLLEAISPVCTKEISEIGLKILHNEFTTKACKIIEPGWRGVKGDFMAEHAAFVGEIPELKKDDELRIKEAFILRKKTKAPSLYTEAEVLSAMKNVGNKIGNHNDFEVRDDIGIGTPATRAAEIEMLFKRNYIFRKSKSLWPTRKGLQVYDWAKDMKIADIMLTAEWELALKDIENNEVDMGVFQQDVENYVSAITDELLQVSVNKDKLPVLNCPKCKTHRLIFSENIIKCSYEFCNWVQLRNVCGVAISMIDIERLINSGKTSLIQGMSSKAGKRFDAYVVLKEDGSTFFEFEQKRG